MIAIGENELKGYLRDAIKCPHCGGIHPIQFGEEILKDGTRKPSELLAFYKCGDKAYLAGINGRAI